MCQVPGGRGPLPPLTIEENLRMGAYPVRKDKERVKAGFDKVNEAFPRLAERRTQLPGRCRVARPRCWPSAGRS